MIGLSLRKASDRNTRLHEVKIGGVSLYFSYETCVAFRAGELVVSENVWSVTTGKHLSEIDGGSKEAKARRVNNGEFSERLNAILAPMNIAV